jgi:tetratricopeptide (TPR) repeat protein
MLVVALSVAVVTLGTLAVVLTLSRARSADPIRAAIAEWETRLQASPDDAEARLGLALAYQRAGRYADALGAYEAVLEIAPDDLGARYNLGVVQIAARQEQAGERTLRDVLAAAPDHVLAAKTLAGRLLEREAYGEALAVIEPALTSRPELADLQYAAGFALERLGRSAEAIGRYRAALRYAPDLEEAAEALRRMGATS